jgi:hypothetical protein
LAIVPIRLTMARTPLVTTALLLLLPASSLWSWAVYRDPAGFTVDLPQGWAARCDAGARRVDLEGAEGAVSILPVFSRNALSRKQAEKTLLEAAG